MGVRWPPSGAFTFWRTNARHGRTICQRLCARFRHCRNYETWSRRAFNGDADARAERAAMAEKPRITLEDLCKAAGRFTAPFDAPPNQTYMIALHVLTRLLGSAWLDKHIDPDQRRSGFLKLNEQSPREPIEQAWRIIDAAECLFNLQVAPGFYEHIKLYAMRADIEACIAELHVARILFSNYLVFSFVEPNDKRGSSYDFEVEMWPSISYQADAKCKTEGSVFSATTIRNSLTKHKGQFPKDGHGVFFVKLPVDWLGVENYAPPLIHEASEFLRNRGRVVSVVFYAAPVRFRDGSVETGHSFKEVVNPRYALDNERDWRILRRWHTPEGKAKALPPEWIRLGYIKKDGYDPPKD